VHGVPAKDEFEVDAKLAPHPVKTGLMRIDEKNGKRARTRFEVLEKFSVYALVRCQPFTGRTHQIRVHARSAGMPIVGDELYDGSKLNLSSLKPNYRLKSKQVEKPLIERVALHAAELRLPHPVTGAGVMITSPMPKDMTVAVKYLRRYAGGGRANPGMEFRL